MTDRKGTVMPTTMTHRDQYDEGYKYGYHEGYLEGRYAGYKMGADLGTMGQRQEIYRKSEGGMNEHTDI